MIFADLELPNPDSSVVGGTHPAAKLSVKDSQGNTKNLRRVRIYGRSVNDGTGYGDVWEALANASAAPIVRTLPTTNKTIQVISSDVNDTSAGTGARTIRVTYLDLAGAEHTADYALNGQTAVVNATTKDGSAFAAPITDCWRVNFVHVLTAGTGLKNAGKISVNDSTQTYVTGIPVGGALIYGWVEIGFNVSHHGFYTVPAGYKAQIKQKLFGCVDASATVKYGKFQLGITDQVTGLLQTEVIAGDSSNSGGTTFPMAFETIIDEKCDFRVQGIGLALATSEMISIIDIIVYPKN